jgi:superoxide dismutase, Fe-Mn family
MRYRIAPLFCRPWTLNGITPRLIESHYENNYGDALNRLNAITKELDANDFATISVHAISRLKQEQIAALNSTLLHELYFASLGGDGRKVPEPLANVLARDFRSIDEWRREFIALANALATGNGWVLLTWVPRDNQLINQTISDGTQAIAGGIPILALDMYEHAYQIDFGTNASAYVAAFMRNIDWSAVEGRYEDAITTKPPRPLVQRQFGDLPSMTVDEVKMMLDQGVPLQVIDTRPRHYSTRAQDIMEGATWRDPERVEEWIGELSKNVPVVSDILCLWLPHWL